MSSTRTQIFGNDALSAEVLAREKGEFRRVVKEEHRDCWLWPQGR